MTGETDDAFLGGRIRVLQPSKGYRAGTDSVLLAAAVGARPGESVLELGCGTGVVLLCLGARIGGLSLTGVERHPYHAALARKNCARNSISAEIVQADIRALPQKLKDEAFDHVVSNPPYLDRRRGKRGGDPVREEALAVEMPLVEWTRVCLRRVRPGGCLTMITASDRLPELLQAIGGVGVSVLPISARVGRDPSRVIVAAIKGGRAPFRLGPQLVSHQGDAHLSDGDDYTCEMRAILRDGARLSATLD